MIYQKIYALEIFQQLVELGCERVNIYNVESEINKYHKELGVLKHD